ncbi:MAG: acetyl-CoA carboxylase biotin carboxyl carrier protein subunit [Calditrichaeota bacterium]|jgi:biotin carboxyl carrier protein|nr:acetyl-CoA carboxylase biotin carboxyl carrier protein subunit [Calditrichota bacterium]MBT7616029.1 acetyl-CoA carboxylase biotin carboxyl carrier protein subunit [Calditrichota bacterium]
MKFFIDLKGKRHNVEIPSAGWEENPSINGDSIKLDSYSNLNGVTSLKINHHPFQIEVNHNSDMHNIKVNGDSVDLKICDERTDSIRKLMGNKAQKHEKIGEIKAPMPGLIVKLLREVGETVQKGQGVIVVEAMKMENEISAPIDGILKKCAVSPGMAVNKGDLLITIE